MRTDEEIKQAVRQAYGTQARRAADAAAGAKAASSCCDAAATQQAASSCCDAAATQRAASSCCDGADEGTPALADLRPGEVVLDLGSGAGGDCLRAAGKVGPQGRVIGLDMTPEAVELAQRRAGELGAVNVEFRRGEIENIPLADGEVDAVLSSCVINLAPDKDAVLCEAYRVLRPGGRMVVSDIVLAGELPAPIRDSPDAWAGCVAGALLEADYLDKIRAAGFSAIEVL